MPRQFRISSESGVYHVMLRGNNKQDIFEYQNDYLKFQELLYQKCHPKDCNGDPLTPCRSLIREDPICHAATKPLCHNY